MLGVEIRALAISIALFLCGCGDLVGRFEVPRPSQQSNLDEKDENACRSRGATPDYPYAFSECKRMLIEERASAAAAAKADADANQ